MKTAEFDYHLPPELIAQHPADRRDRSRMMVVNRRTKRLEHRHFGDLPSFLRNGDLVVVNDTRVIPARVWGRKAASGGKVEILLLEETAPGTWDVLLHASRRPGIGSLITLGDAQAVAVLLADGEKGRATIRIESSRPWLDVLEEIGEPPLPPYIHRSEGTDQRSDRERYQTIYAREPGAVAAPTAGLHFTDEVLKTLERQGVRRTAVTLHVGLGTFRPVDAEQVEDHRMEAERYSIPSAAAELIAATRGAGGRIVAVGTTTVRTLETVAAEHGEIRAAEGRSSLFIHPPYQFKAVDALLTNFHLPRSTLIMMVCAFAGHDLTMEAYRTAVAERYRFYSYGDCMLIA